MKRILLVFDKNHGHQQQLLALIESFFLPLSYEIVVPEFSWVAKIPIIGKQVWLSGIKRQKNLKFIKGDTEIRNNNVHASGSFDMILSAGHMTARPALFLQKKFSIPWTVHLLSPNGNGRHFDLVVRPEHEKKENQKNLLLTFGALSRWGRKRLALLLPSAKKILHNKIATAKWRKKKKIGVLLGGPSLLQHMPSQSIEQLISLLTDLAKNYCLLITPSPRTPFYVRVMIEKNLAHRDNVWLDDGVDNNIYGMILALGDGFLVTDDSVNMITESVLTDKKVFLFSLPYKLSARLFFNRVKMQRHKKFLAGMKNMSSVFDASQIAKKINRPDKKQKNMMNSESVAMIIRKKFFA